MFGGLRATVDLDDPGSLKAGCPCHWYSLPPSPGLGVNYKEKGLTLKIVHTRTYKPEPHGCAPHPQTRPLPPKKRELPRPTTIDVLQTDGRLPAEGEIKEGEEKGGQGGRGG